MPYICNDWGSRGDLWVKTDFGWRVSGARPQERGTSGGSNTSYDKTNRQSHHDNYQQAELSSQIQPCVMYQRSNKNGCTSISELIIRLDMNRAVRDIRRSNFMSKFLTIIFTKKLTDLSGTAQRLVFKLLESMVSHEIRR